MEIPIFPDDCMIRAYDRLAPSYDAMHRRWLRVAGGEAQAALEAAMRMAITPHSAMLDAGCGTGRLARALLSEGTTARRMTLLDASRSMLEACADLPVQRCLGRLEALPFDDSAFDVIACAWALETTPTPELALDELARVLRPGGVLCLAFCADTPSSGLLDWAARRVLTLRGTGRFLQTADVVSELERSMICNVRIVPVAGPAAMIVARRAAEADTAPDRRGIVECTVSAEVDSLCVPH